jgi:hypothetical protein
LLIFAKKGALLTLLFNRNSVIKKERRYLFCDSI